MIVGLLLIILGATLAIGGHLAWLHLIDVYGPSGRRAALIIEKQRADRQMESITRQAMQQMFDVARRPQ